MSASPENSEAALPSAKVMRALGSGARPNEGRDGGHGNDARGKKRQPKQGVKKRALAALELAKHRDPEQPLIKPRLQSRQLRNDLPLRHARVRNG